MPAAQQLRSRFDRAIAGVEANRRLIKDKLTAKNNQLHTLCDDNMVMHKGVEVLTRLSELSKRGSITHVETVVTHALRTILADDTYQFKIEEKEQKRGIIYEFMYAKQGGPWINVVDATGGGVADIISVFLTIVVYILADPKGRRLFVLDERFKFISREHQERISMLLSSLVEKLDCQFIIVSHEKEIVLYADKVYRFTCSKGETSAKDITHDKSRMAAIDPTES